MELLSLFDELSFLTEIDAPSGFEEPLLRYCRDRLFSVADTVTVDVRGNLTAVKKGRDGAPVVMVVVHADEVGLIVTHVDADGFLRFSRIGTPTDMVLPGHRVHVLGESGPLDGVVGLKPGHVLTGEEARRVPDIGAMYIDIGASSAQEVADWGVEVGTPVVFDGPLVATRNKARVFGKAVDDRAGLLAMLRTAEILSEKKCEPTIVWSVSVEEEIGLRGAQAMAFDLKPDVVIALDTCPAGGTPDLRPEELPWQIGKGPLIKVAETRGLATHRILRDLFRETAETASIPCQLIVDTAGITDATSVQQTSGGIAALSVGLPRRYSHSSVEVLDLNDLGALIDLLTAVLPKITDVDSLKRI